MGYHGWNSGTDSITFKQAQVHVAVSEALGSETQDTCGRTSTTTTTVLDGKNGSIHKLPGKMTRSVSQDLKTTFSSPAAWLLVVALIVTWSAVAIVIFDLVDYKSFSGGTISKLRNDPVRIIHDAVDDTTDWIYAIFSTVSNLISFEEERK
ncbi:PREDICTED: triadin, partial [Nanorana parkeri]|uniref:triadin n=1 Tax=Nanorana parkeri TaxID=125878 RepID=UPI0008541127